MNDNFHHFGNIGAETLPSLGVIPGSSTNSLWDTKHSLFKVVVLDRSQESEEFIHENTIIQGTQRNFKSVLKLRDELNKANEILDLPENFDGEGSPRYDWETMKVASDFLTTLWDFFSEQNIEELLIPDILPGPEGTIDIYWDSPNFDLLINVSNGVKPLIKYYGKVDDFEIEDSVRTDSVVVITDFLKRVQENVH